MSIPFNVAYTGLVQKYEKEIGASRGDVANNTARLQDFTAEVNEAFDEYVALAIKTSGKWQFDDSNHSDYPTIETDLISGQRSYTFVDDEQGNLILDIYRVMVKGTDGIYREIGPVDMQSDLDTESFYNGEDFQNIPTRYDKTANGIFLDPIPNYNWRLVQEGEKGLKIFINREASYFTYTDTTRKPGVTGTHHKFFYLRPALDYARRNNLNSYNRLETEYMKTVEEIKQSFAQRAKDETWVLSPEPINSI